MPGVPGARFPHMGDAPTPSRDDDNRRGRTRQNQRRGARAGAGGTAARPPRDRRGRRTQPPGGRALARRGVHGASPRTGGFRRPCAFPPPTPPACPPPPPFPGGLGGAVVGMGCFGGAERIFWQAPGVYTPAVGYAGGFTKNPTYEEVCSGRTGHTEAVLVVFDPQQTSYEEILRLFWENHDPTQGMRQGNDQGTQYRSAIYTASDAQRAAAESSRTMFQGELSH